MISISKLVSHWRGLGSAGATVIVLLVTVPSHAAVSDTIRVNCGGGAYVDKAGRHWAADSGSVGGNAYSATSTVISGTNDQPLFNTERWGDTQEEPFYYLFDVKPGKYKVSLYEGTLYSNWCHVGDRVFHVDINGNRVLSNYDIYAEVGCSVAQIKRFTVTSHYGKIKISFTNVGDGHPKVNAIEIVPSATTTSVSGAAGDGKASGFTVSGGSGGLLVETQTEGAYFLELKNLQGQRVDRKVGFGAGSQSFANLRPGLYFLTTRADGLQADTRTVSVVR
jgi:hypothetical protein